MIQGGLPTLESATADKFTQQLVFDFSLSRPVEIGLCAGIALTQGFREHQALHTLKSKGVNIRAADLAFLSPYATSKLKRFGDYPTNLNPEPMPTRTTLPL